MKPNVFLLNLDRSFSDIPTISVPSILMLPESAVSSPPIRFKSVDFPEPDGPSIVNISPALTSKLTPFNISDCTFPFLYAFLRFFTSININHFFLPVTCYCFSLFKIISSRLVTTSLGSSLK